MVLHHQLTLFDEDYCQHLSAYMFSTIFQPPTTTMHGTTVTNILVEFSVISIQEEMS